MTVLWKYVYIKSKPGNVCQLHQWTPFRKLYVTALEPSSPSGTLSGLLLISWLWTLCHFLHLYNFYATLKLDRVYEEMRCQYKKCGWTLSSVFYFHLDVQVLLYSIASKLLPATHKSKDSHPNETFLIILINADWKENCSTTTLSSTGMCILNTMSTNPNLLLPVFHINIYQHWTLGRLHPVLCQAWNHIHCSSLHLCAGEMNAA